MIKKYKFEHKNENFFESVGLGKEKEKIGDFILKTFKENDQKSQSIEVILNSDLSEHEKFISLFLLGKMYSDLKISAIKKMFKDFNEFIEEIA